MDPHRYPIEPRWQLRLKDIGVSPIDVLRHARLPLDLFARKSPTVTGHEYLRLWAGLEAVPQDHPSFPLDLATSSTPETFRPPVFACFCSPNLLAAAERCRFSASALTHLLIVEDAHVSRDGYVTVLDASVNGQYGTSVVLELLGNCRGTCELLR